MESTQNNEILVSDGPKKYPNLKPWQPGQSGNPGGRPANPFKDPILKALDGDKRAEFIEAFVTKALEGDERAARLLLEYSVGKPPAAQEDRDALAAGGGEGWAAFLAAWRASKARVVELEAVEEPEQESGQENNGTEDEKP